MVMVRKTRWLTAVVAALALLSGGANAVQAQLVCYRPAPVVVAPAVRYYAPAPMVSYYTPAPVVRSYYVAPAPVVASYYVAPAAMTTYRYGPLGRLRSVRSYYPAPAPVIARYGYFYP